ncbi:MAG TPA: FAD-dependent oxidoreductase [Caulobacteraceae bacterium]|nr:FAD-dependent oxidoreductase [Caulobacteraceae bacterium]
MEQVTRAGTIVVAGAGAIGSTLAFMLARAGRQVILVDSVPPGANASGIAAGMLAPAFESLFDADPADRFALLASARDAWQALAAAIGLPLARDGSMAVGSEAEVAGWSVGLERLGAQRRILSSVEVARLAPAVRGGLCAVFSPEDWRLDAVAALAALHRAAETEGVRLAAARLTGFDGERAHLNGAAAIPADLIVLATGAARELAGVAPELAALRPVKGHILRAAAAWPAGPVIRAPGIYLCAGSGGAILGASMEAGLADTRIDEAVVRALVARAERIVPGVGRLCWRAAAGVRAATGDGLPMAGVSSSPGVLLAVGARRNGWLLAPVIAQVVLELLDGAPASPLARLFAPSRPGVWSC